MIRIESEKNEHETSDLKKKAHQSRYERKKMLIPDTICAYPLME